MFNYRVDNLFCETSRNRGTCCFIIYEYTSVPPLNLLNLPT